MEWIRYQAPSFSIEHPTNWMVNAMRERSSLVVSAPETQAIAFVRSVYIPQCILPLPEILEDAEYLAECGFKNAKPERISNASVDCATGFLSYSTPQGPGRASVRALRMKDSTVLEGFGALEVEFEQMQPLLLRIVQSFRKAPVHEAQQPAGDQAQPALLVSKEAAAEIYQQILQSAAAKSEESKLASVEFDANLRAAIENHPPDSGNIKSALKAFNNLDAYIRG